MQLDPDFREFVESFNDHDVRYLVVGGVEFDGAWSGRLSIDVAWLPLEVIGRDDPIRNKVAADRPQDRADVARLTRGDSSE